MHAFSQRQVGQAGRCAAGDQGAQGDGFAVEDILQHDRVAAGQVGQVQREIGGAGDVVVGVEARVRRGRQVQGGRVRGHRVVGEGDRAAGRGAGGAGDALHLGGHHRHDAVEQRPLQVHEGAVLTLVVGAHGGQQHVGGGLGGGLVLEQVDDGTRGGDALQGDALTAVDHARADRLQRGRRDVTRHRHGERVGRRQRRHVAGGILLAHQVGMLAGGDRRGRNRSGAGGGGRTFRADGEQHRGGGGDLAGEHGELVAFDQAVGVDVIPFQQVDGGALLDVGDELQHVGAGDVVGGRHAQVAAGEQVGGGRCRGGGVQGDAVGRAVRAAEAGDVDDAGHQAVRAVGEGDASRVESPGGAGHGGEAELGGAVEDGELGAGRQ